MKHWELFKSFLEEGEGGGTTMEGWTKSGYIICIYGNVTTKPLYNCYKLMKTFFKKEMLKKTVIEWC
jgi:hypothetical protein